MKVMLRKNLADYSKILLGLTLVAMGLNLFLVPNRIAAGGISGVGVILYHLFGVPVGVTMLVLNAVLFAVAFRAIGRSFGARSIFSAVTLSVLIDVLPVILPIKPYTDDLLIAVIFGDLLTGVGIAIVFNTGASTGGTDIIAKLMNKYTAIELGRSLLMVDFCVAALAGVLLGSLDVGMYSLLAILINTFTIDAFLVSINIKKQAFILSRVPEKIAGRIFSELNRGATYLDARGAYTGRDSKALICVVGARQINQLIDIVKQEDERAFVVVGNVNEVRGEGFKALRAAE